MSLYVTANEFKQAPTGIDTSTLDQTNIGNQAAQDSVLLTILRRASAWVDTIVQQDSLEASLNTEIKSVRMGRDGLVNVHVDQAPIITLQSVQFRYHPRDPYQTVDMSSIELRESWFTIYDLFYNTSLGQDLASLSYYDMPLYNRQELLPLTLKYTYLNGWANTTLSLAASVNATSITVADSTGIVANQKLSIYDGIAQETVTVTAINGNVLTLSRGLLFAHAVGVGVSAIPEAVKQATIMLATALIKNRGSLAITMQESSVLNVNASPNQSGDVDIAKKLLAPYRRVVVS
jgi:hypothetical protein